MHRLVRLSPVRLGAPPPDELRAGRRRPELPTTSRSRSTSSDLRIDTYRAPGAGGQHVNKTDSAVRITHLPTGIVVQCQNERSQHAEQGHGDARAQEPPARARGGGAQEELARERGTLSDNSFGSQIRSYVLHPYTMVNDHRTGLKDGNAQGVLDGDLDPFISAYLLGAAAGTLGTSAESDEDV